MRDRVATLGGQFEVARGARGGTTLTIDLPLPDPSLATSFDAARARRVTPLPASRQTP